MPPDMGGIFSANINHNRTFIQQKHLRIGTDTQRADIAHTAVPRGHINGILTGKVLIS